MQTHLYNLATDKYNGLMAKIFKSLLFILSVIYGVVVRILFLFYRSKAHGLNCKVISVGNITLGGTGKTSLVEYIAKYLTKQGHAVAVLSRGYRRKLTTYHLPLTSYQTMGDEPYMLSKKLENIPVIVDADRIRAAEKAIKDYSVDTLILDDAFQQWKIKKDLEIVTLDAAYPLGNKRLIPRGILREPISSLKRADLFVLTKVNLHSDTKDIKVLLSQINPSIEIFESVHQPLGFSQINNYNELFSLDTFKGKIVTLFSGIGCPDSFEGLIKDLGINIGLCFRFRDHHNYTQQDLDRIVKLSQDKNIEIIITTEKDSVRLKNLQLTTYNLQLFILHIQLKIIKDEQVFHNRLLRLYSS